jgi:tRNA A-37 threonylcarbamoyl transferase component Bud32
MAFAVDLTGSILDRRYRITGLLGKGGMGHVYDAVHVALDQRVAVKVLHPRYAYEERFRERFLQEARAASKIRHPNVVEIKDFGETPDGSVYFAMEYLGGHDVGAELQRHDKLPWARTRSILLQAASALHAAHIKRIIHRDIKPGNCFLIEDDTEGRTDVVKLLDFGIAKARARAVETTTGVVKGKFAYMSPEQANGEPVEPSADVWSLAVVLWEMLAGQRLFEASSAFSTLASSMLASIPRLDKVCDVPESLARVVEQALERSPASRFQNAREFATALRAASPYAQSDRTQVAGLVQGLFGEALIRAREESVRRVVRATTITGPRRPSIAPWAVAGSVGALALALFTMQPRLRPAEVQPETTASPARAMKEPERTGQVTPEPAAPRELAPAPQVAAPSAQPPHRTRAAKSGRAETTSVAGTARLTLVTEPWSEVTSDGKLLGTTPLVKVELPAGKHELTLKNPSTGVSKTLLIELAPGQVLSRRVVLDANEAAQQPSTSTQRF